MKRFIFSAIALAAASTACTESGIIETPSSYGNQIVFDTYIGKTPVTKADTCDINYLKLATAQGGGAHLMAFTSDASQTLNPDYVNYESGYYLNGDLVFNSPEGGTAYWAYLSEGQEEEAYMPAGFGLAAVAYNLKAADGIVDGSMTVNKDNFKFQFEVNDVVSEQLDLLVTPLTFVYETGGTTSVPLRFFHLMSRIGFKVMSTDASNAEIKINRVSLCGDFYKRGTVSLNWAIASSTGASLTVNSRPVIVPETTGTAVSEYSLLPEGTSFTIWASECSETAQPIFSDPADEDNRYMMIIPSDRGGASVVVEYQLNDQDPITAIVDLDEIDRSVFEGGRAYEFILKIATKTIDFSAEVIEGDWGNQEETDIPKADGE